MKSVWIFYHYAAPPEYSGGLRHHNLAKFLIKQGYEATVFVASTIHNTDVNLLRDSQESFIEKTMDGVPYIFIKSRDYKGNGKSRILNMFDYTRGLKKITKKMTPPDIILAASPHPFTCSTGIKIAKHFHIPCVCEVLDLWPESIVEYLKIPAENPVIRWMYGLEKKIYKKADAMIFSMEGGALYIQDKGWDQEIDLEKVYHVNMGIDIAQRDCDFLEQRFDAAWMNEKMFNVVYCGAIRTMNNVKTIIEAAAILKEKGYSDIRFLIYGDGDQRQELEMFAKESGIDNVYFGGRIQKNHIPWLLDHADLAILNYQDVSLWRYGGSQTKLFDYLASGKPILTNIHMGYSLLERYACGYETEDQSVDAFVKGILHFYRMPEEERIAMGKRAREAAEAYDQPVLVDKLIQVFEKVLSKEG